MFEFWISPRLARTGSIFDGRKLALPNRRGPERAALIANLDALAHHDVE
jgi:hypothetical protein